jgi:hypothetical protein
MAPCVCGRNTAPYNLPGARDDLDHPVSTLVARLVCSRARSSRVLGRFVTGACSCVDAVYSASDKTLYFL